jgi:hypothetical protein
MPRSIRYAGFCLLLLSSLAHGAVSGQGGLEAVAVSPDSKTIAVGGQNRVIYLVDAADLTVKKRLWIGSRIGSMTFNRAGARLIVEDESDRLRLLDPATGKEIAKVEGVSGMVVSRRAGLVAVRDLLKVDKPSLRLLSLDDLAEKGRIAVVTRPAAYHFTDSGKRLVVLSKGLSGEEKRIRPAEIPVSLAGLAREAFRQRHDGYHSYLTTFDVADGKVLAQQKLWYTSDSDSTVVVPAGKETFLFNRVNFCARIAGGKITLFSTSLRFNQAIGVSEDGKHLQLGGMAEGTSGPVEGRRVSFEIAPLPGQAELFTRFGVLEDGSAYGVTTGYRLVKIGRNGRVEKVVAVY